MGKVKAIRIWLGVGCLYIARWVVFQKLTLLLRRMAWRIAGRGPAPPLTVSLHTYSCVCCFTDVILAMKDVSEIMAPMVDLKCPKCHIMRHFGWIESKVEIIR